MAKQFGLIMPGKQKQTVVQRRTIFDEDQAFEDEEEEDSFRPMAPRASTIPSKVKKETKMVIDKALEEDPNVFDYDGVYDQMQEAELSKKKDFKPKYMSNLIKNAELRKRDQERREEKKIQKEREEEGDEFKDKEAFITGAYKEKLEELRQTEEREQREKEIEEMFDVKKQADMSGFHRHLLNQHIGEEAVPEISRDKYDRPGGFKTRKVQNQSLRSRRDENDDEEEEEESESVPEEEIPEEVHETSKITQDKSRQLSQNPEPGTNEEGSVETHVDGSTEQEQTENDPKEELKEEVVSAPEPIPEPVDRKVLIEQLFTKRTVGDKFDDAVKRYNERKALRGS